MNSEEPKVPYRPLTDTANRFIQKQIPAEACERLIERWRWQEQEIMTVLKAMAKCPPNPVGVEQLETLAGVYRRNARELERVVAGFGPPMAGVDWIELREEL